MKLCIGILTIPERKDMYLKLRAEVTRQQNWLKTTWGFSHVRVIIEDAPRGAKSVGAKRQSIYERSDCIYTMILDDDDFIAPNALEKIVQGIEKTPDVITFKQLCYLEHAITVCDIGIGNDMEPASFEEFKRPAFHICPMKTTIARSEPFPDKNFGEDLEWAAKINKKLKTEVKVPGILHIYDRRTKSYTQ